MNDKAQLHTLEGLAAALLMTITLLAITQGTMIITPQNELIMDVQLKQIASDALTIVNIAPQASIQDNLTACIAGWDMNEANIDAGNMDVLNKELAYLIPEGIFYNVNVAYFDAGTLYDKRIIVNGAATENVAVARRLVTLSNSTVTQYGGAWNIPNDELQIVEVRLTAWRI